MLVLNTNRTPKTLFVVVVLQALEVRLPPNIECCPIKNDNICTYNNNICNIRVYVHVRSYPQNSMSPQSHGWTKLLFQLWLHTAHRSLGSKRARSTTSWVVPSNSTAGSWNFSQVFDQKLLQRVWFFWCFSSSPSDLTCWESTRSSMENIFMMKLLGFNCFGCSRCIGGYSLFM